MRYFISILILLTGYILQAQDLALSEPGGAILSPASGCSLGSSENVAVRIFNFGSNLPAGTSFTVSYTVNAGVPVTELAVLSATLLSHSSFTYTFVTPVNLSPPGNYTFNATVSLAGDINTTNNTIAGYMVTNSAATVGGNVSTDQSICGATNSGTLTLSGHTGTISRWETSQDGGLTWRYVSQTTTQQNFLNLDVTTQYRAVVKSGACNEAPSGYATITISCPLPLTWIGFEAHRAGNHVELDWQTANEVNTRNFVIECDNGNNRFDSIGTLAAQPSTMRYHFTDGNTSLAALQYRIRQVDQDNRYSYSKTVIVGAVSGQPSIVLRNNPVKNGRLSFDVIGYPNANAVIAVFNMNGQKIQSTTVQLSARYPTINIPVQAVPGVYLLTIQSGNLFNRQQFLITK